MYDAIGFSVFLIPAGDVAVTVMSPAMILGGVESLTWTPKLAVPVLPNVSAAVQVTVVVPIGNFVADAGEQLTALGRSGTPLSAAVTEYVTIAPSGPFASTVIPLGALKVGGVRSTVHEREAVLELFDASVALTWNV